MPSFYLCSSARIPQTPSVLNVMPVFGSMDPPN
jgi:hypothetical protein